MIRGPKRLWENFDRWMTSQNVTGNEQSGYRKWLRFYLDCFVVSPRQSLPISVLLTDQSRYSELRVAVLAQN